MGKPGEKPSEQGKNQQQTPRTYGTRPESNPGDSRGRRHRAIPAPLCICSILVHTF